LFLDEMPLFRKDSLEALRAPLEDGKVRIARRAGTVTFPCRFSLVAAMNPCPCGFGGEFPGRCECSDQSLRCYRTKVSGPMLDRFDMHVYMERVPADHLLGATRAEPSAAIRDRVEAARALQRRRYGTSVATNASVPRSRLRSEGRFSTDAFPPLRARVDAGQLTGRGVDRVLRLARTIADLGRDDCVSSEHVARALLLRAGSVVAELAA
jgi:magnesium chelatase family protein